MSLRSTQFQLVTRWLQYFRRAKTIFDIHSPFVADLVNAVVEDSRHFYAFSEIEALRAKMLESQVELNIQDFGAGSKVNPNATRTVADIARYSAISTATGQQLFRLAHFCKPQTILELGTSLGVSTLYLASAALHSKVITLEGCPDIAAVAQEHFKMLKRENIQLYEGEFKQNLPEALKTLQKLDFLFLDGDHRAGASWQYFEQCLEFANTNSVFVIADIHWSREMETAWSRMQAHPRVTLSLDLFHLGLLFFRTEPQQKEHFTIIQKRYKPWRLGIFGE